MPLLSSFSTLKNFWFERLLDCEKCKFSKLLLENNFGLKLLNLLDYVKKYFEWFNKFKLQLLNLEKFVYVFNNCWVVLAKKFIFKYFI